MPVENDEDLVSRVRAGDTEAVRTLHRRYVSMVFGIARRSLDPAAAEEIVQDVFLQVWRKSSTFDPARGRFRPWLLEIAHSRVANEFRRRSRRPDTRSGEEALTTLPDPEAGPDEAAWADHRRDVIRNAVETLPEAQQQAVRMAFFDDLTQEQVASYLGIPVGTAKSRIRSGLKRLQVVLAPMGVLMAVVASLLGIRVEQRRELDERALRSVTSSDLLIRHLSPVGDFPSPAHGNYRVRPAGGMAVLTGSFLPPPPHGSRYVLWVLHAGTWVSLGNVTPDADGKALKILEGPETTAPDAIRVTRETGHVAAPSLEQTVMSWSP